MTTRLSGSVLRTLAMFALGATAAAQAHVDRELTLDQSAPVVDGLGPALSIEFTAQQFGTCSIWAESDTGDLVMRLERADGTKVAEDDDTGGARTPWIRQSVSAGERWIARIGAKSLDQPISVRWRVRELPETDATKRGHERALAVLTEARALAELGEQLRATEVLRAGIEAYIADETCRSSVSFHRTLMQMARQSGEWRDAPTLVRASRARLEAMRGFYPTTSEAWTEVYYAICSGLIITGPPDDAVGACTLALDLAERGYPPGHINIAISRIGLGQAYRAARDIELAHDTLLRGIEQATATGLVDEQRLAIMHVELATILFDLGELEESRRLYQNAFDSLESKLPADDPTLINVRSNLAVALYAMGDSRAAADAYRAQLAAFERSVPPLHPDRIMCMLNLANTRVALGEQVEAVVMLEEVVRLQEQAQLREGADGDLADIALAVALNSCGRSEEALKLITDRRALRERMQRLDASTQWRVDGVIARSLRALGRSQEALVEAERALQSARRALPIENPDLAETLQLTAALCTETGDRERAYRLATASVRDTQGYLARCAASLTMRQAERVQAHWSRLVSDGIELLVATADVDQRVEADMLAFELAESARGIGLTLLRASNAGGTSNSDFEELRAAARRAAREVAQLGASNGSTERLQAAVEQRERAERELRSALHLVAGAGVSSARPDGAAIARRLGADEALIAYWRVDVRELEPSPSASNTSDASAPPASTSSNALRGASVRAARTPTLIAFVARSDGSVVRVDLGPLAPIAEDIERWKAAASSGDASQANNESTAGAALRRRVVDPLQPALAGAKRWRVELDDVMHLVALDALPLEDARAQQRLGDSVRIVHAAMAERATRPPVDETSKRALVALGGVDFDHDPEGVGARTIASTRANSALAAALDGGPWGDGFPELWETQEEIDGVARLFARTFGEGPDARGRTTMLSEREATKAALLEHAHDATYLHIATHGFFAKGDAHARLAERSPLTLCGLALAGANLGSSETGFEGVITADELSTLDLSRCELAVLSACDTNVGTLSAGQGVASFQKALHAAGARTMITSLWKVDDAASRELMLAFYDGLWTLGLDPEDALWRAKTTLRERRAPTRDWAGWVLSRL